MDYTTLDEHITALREGNTLTENQVKALCEKVRPIRDPETSKKRLRLAVRWVRPMTRATGCHKKAIISSCLYHTAVAASCRNDVMVEC
jgi:hypothetical protein